MSLGTNPENFPIVFLLFFAVIPAVLVVLGIGGFLLRLLRIENTFLQFMLVVFLFIGPLVGASLYLDAAGTLVKAQVQSRAERIRDRAEGDWTHEYSVVVQYTLGDQPPANATLGVHFDSAL